MIDSTSANAPLTDIPTIRKGRLSSHTIGYRINASNASGHEITSSRIHNKNFTSLSQILTSYPSQ